MLSEIVGLGTLNVHNLQRCKLSSVQTLYMGVTIVLTCEELWTVEAHTS